MSLQAGQTLAHYRIAAAIGAGGMGEVYRATDTKLGRHVAIKVLPSDFAQDSERLARFERVWDTERGVAARVAGNGAAGPEWAPGGEEIA